MRVGVRLIVGQAPKRLYTLVTNITNGLVLDYRQRD